MDLFVDILESFFVGVLYSICVYKIAEANSPSNKSKLMMLHLIGGVVGIMLAYVAYQHRKIVIRNGLLFGSFIILFNLIWFNWGTMGNNVKLFIFISTFLSLIWYIHKKPTKSRKIRSKPAKKLAMIVNDDEFDVQ